MTKLGEVVDIIQSHAAVQSDLDMLQKWSDRNFMKSKKEKYKDLYLGRENPKHQYMPGATQLGSTFAEKNLGIVVETKMNMSQECACALRCFAASGKVLPTGGWR